jgi:hypothetical protein
MVQKTKKVFIGLLMSIVIGSSVTWSSASPVYALIREYKVLSYIKKNIPKLINSGGMATIQALFHQNSKLSEKVLENPFVFPLYSIVKEVCSLPQYKTHCSRPLLTEEFEKMKREGQALLQQHRNRCASLVKEPVTAKNINSVVYALMHCSVASSGSSEKGSNGVDPSSGSTRKSASKKPASATNGGGSRKPPPKYKYAFVCIKKYEPRTYEEEREYQIIKSMVYAHIKRLDSALMQIEKNIQSAQKKVQTEPKKIQFLYAQKNVVIAEKKKLIDLFKMFELCQAYHETPSHLNANNIADIIEAINSSKFPPPQNIPNRIHDPNNAKQMNEFIREYKNHKLGKWSPL